MSGTDHEREDEMLRRMLNTPHKPKGEKQKPAQSAD